MCRFITVPLVPAASEMRQQPAMDTAEAIESPPLLLPLLPLLVLLLGNAGSIAEWLAKPYIWSVLSAKRVRLSLAVDIGHDHLCDCALRS